jgi:hypothetical protein
MILGMEGGQYSANQGIIANRYGTLVNLFQEYRQYHYDQYVKKMTTLTYAFWVTFPL